MFTNEQNGEGTLHKYVAIIEEKKYEFVHPEVTGRQILEKAGKEPAECYSLFQKLEGCDFELIRSDQVVDLRQLGIEKFVVKDPIVFNYTVNSEPETTDQKQLTPDEILHLAGISEEENYLIQVLKDMPEIVYAFKPHEHIKMVCPGLHFITAKWVKLVDVEEYGKTCKVVPPAKQYRIKIDKNYHVVNSPYITGRQLIQLEHKQPVENWDVYKFYSNQPKPKKVGHNEVVDLTERCLVRFVLQPKEQKDGNVIARRTFSLPEDDVDFLNKQGLLWEALSLNGLWLIIHNYPVPHGYNVNKVQVALMISPNYPASEIDMAYFHPHLARSNGRAVHAITPQIIDGRNFQRWSRHRQPGEWRPGIDNIQTHLVLVDNWLLNELTR